MTKQDILRILQEYPEDSLLWEAIANLLDEHAELERLSAYSVADARRGYGWECQYYSPRLHELELKFGV